MPGHVGRVRNSISRRLNGAAALVALSMAGCAPMAELAPLAALPIVGNGMEGGAPGGPEAMEPRPAAVQEVAVRPGRPAMTAAMLKGMATSEVDALLGPPSFLRRDAKAEIWQYFGRGCVLDLFVYEEAGTRRVIHHQLRSQVPGKAADARCFDDLLAGGRGPRPG